MTSISEALPPAVSLGIASGPKERDAWVCLLDRSRQSLSTFEVSTNGSSIRQHMLDQGQWDVMDDANITALAEFLANELPSGAAPAVLVEARKILAHPEHQGTPAGIFSWHASSLCTLMTLMHPLGMPFLFGCYEVPDRECIVVHHVVNSEQYIPITNRQQPRMLGGDLLRSCAKLLVNEDPTPPQVAAIASLLASAPGAYYYWSTFYEPPSLGDVIAHHNHRQSLLRVITQAENFSVRLRFGSHTTEDISLEYTLAVQANQDLGPHDASKFALVHICREFGFDLRCYSRRADARGGHPRRVWPWSDEDAWAIEKIRLLRP